MIQVIATETGFAVINAYTAAEIAHYSNMAELSRAFRYNALVLTAKDKATLSEGGTVVRKASFYTPITNN